MASVVQAVARETSGAKKQDERMFLLILFILFSSCYSAAWISTSSTSKISVAPPGMMPEPLSP